VFDRWTGGLSEMDQRGKRTWLMAFAASVASLAVVTYVDYATGFEIRVYAFYFIPICLCAWYLGRASVLCFSVLGAVCWFFADLFSGHVYSSEAYRYWNGFISFVPFAVVGLVLNRLKTSLEAERRAHEELSRSTQEIRDLQNQLQVVCSWTKRIEVDGKWVPIDEFLENQLHLKLTHGISPEASRRFREQAEGKKTPPTGGSA
jgi:K+-sensing histidine kinase KdpD